MPKPPARPFTERLQALLKSERSLSNKEIAQYLGYDRQPNILSMFKAGVMKVPLAKVRALAKALGADPGHLLRLAFNEYSPELLEDIDATMGLANRDERRLLDEHRRLTKGIETSLPDTFYVGYRALLEKHIK